MDFKLSLSQKIKTECLSCIIVHMTLSEELSWRGFLEQTTFKDLRVIDDGGIKLLYWGVDPSSDSMTIGNLAAAMMVMHFIKAGHKAYLLIGGATGLIGDPDGKAVERELKSIETITANKEAIVKQYQKLFAGQSFEIVDNYDWFKDLGYLQFLRDVGKHVPMRQMLGREFVQSRLSDESSGISYAEFSYSLIQGYDFLTLFKDHGVSLQLSGADQWGNCIAGVELIRRITGEAADIWTSPLIIDKSTGKKFGKSESGAVWLDPKKTTPTAFYQFWINVADDSLFDFLKIYTWLSKEEIDELMSAHRAAPKERIGQKRLASEVTRIVHGEEATKLAEAVTGYLTGERSLGEASNDELEATRREIPTVKVSGDLSLINALVSSGLAKSNSEAKSLIEGGAIYVHGQPFKDPSLASDNFENGRLIVRRGKAFSDSALLEL